MNGSLLSDVNSLEQQATSQLKAKHYKEAINLYKQLRDISDDKKWSQQLAYCYLQRATSFAERGMYREALLLWDNYIQFAESPEEALDLYICWQIQAQDGHKIQTALKQLSVQQIDQQFPELAVLLGCLILTEKPEFKRYLPQDSIFIAHLKIAQVALQAYLDNDQQQLNEVLKQIPYRSAFRDFRTLLNAAQNYPQSIEQALTKISESSPYYQAFSLLHCCTFEGARLVQQLGKYSYSQAREIAEIKGFNNHQQQLIESLVQHRGDISDQVKFNALIQYQPLWPTGVAEDICKAMLIHYPEGHKDFKKHFNALSSFNENRLKALASENKNNNIEAEAYWRQCVEALQYENTDNNLKIALILRHMATLQDDIELCNQLMIESLDYDADDLASYQHILHYFKQNDLDRAEYQQWLQLGLEHFPQSTELLTLAVQQEIENRQYKKISEYALQIISLDPLNRFAKDILFSSYLDLARKLIQNKDYQNVEHYINQAEDLKLGQKHQAQVQLIRGLYYYADQDKEEGLALITESLAKIHKDPVNRCLQAAMEALLTALPVTNILEEIETAENYLLSEQQLNQVIQQLNFYAKDFDHQLLLLKALDRISPALTNSLSQKNYDEPLLIELSETLEKINAFELLQHCAKLAAERWDTVIWQYYHIYSELKGMADKCSSAQINRLEKIREQAINDKDERTKVLIDVFIEQYYQAHSETSTGLVDSLFTLNSEEGEDAYIDPTEQLFKHIPEDELLKVMDKSDELMMETTPEQLVEDLTQDSDKNEHILIAMMQDPDLFSALIVIKAAISLEIDIKLSINDVLGFFNVEQVAGAS